MINSFTHYLKTTIEFGNGKRFEIKNLIEEKNAKKVLLVCDPTVYKLGIANDIIASVEEAGASAVAFTEVEPDPRVATVDKCGALCKAEKCDLVIVAGGGSSMDIAKGAAILATNEGSIHDYLAGRGEEIKEPVNPPIPLIAIPTTSGSGSEVSECIVIVDTNNIKDIMFSPMLAATYAVVDPELTYSVPKNTTINTGLDVLSHALEAYSSVMDDAVAELMALEALRIVFRSLPLCVNENDKAARNKMAYASLLAGVAQSKCGCVIPHAASCPLTVYHNVPHGLGCGVLQIPTIDYNRDVCKEKYKRVLEYIGAKLPEHAQPADVLIEKVRELFRAVGTEEKLDIGAVTEDELKKYAKDAMMDDGVNVNPRAVGEEDLMRIYKMILK